MNILSAKLNIIKLYFQADKKRIGAVLVLFALFIGAGWMILTPQTLADDFGYYYGDSGWGGGSDWGYSDSGGGYSYDYSTPSYSYDYSSPSVSYDYYYGSVPDYSYDYSYDYSAPSSSYDYYYGSVPDYGYGYDYDYYNNEPYSYDYYTYTPSDYGYYDYGYYEPAYYAGYDYFYGGYGGGYDYEQNYTYIDTYNYTYDDYYYYATSTRPDVIYTSYPDLNVYKTVKNVTKGEGAWQKITSTNQGDTIAFSIKVASTGRGQANNVSVRDTLPYQFSYITGTTKIDDGYASDNLFSTSGLFLGYIPEGQTRTITFEASVTSTGSAYSGTNTYTNYAYARGDNIYERSDTAEVVVSSTYTPYTPSTPSTPSYSYYTPTYYPSYTTPSYSYTPSYPSYLPSLNIPSAEAATVKSVTGADYLSLAISLMFGLTGAGASYVIMKNPARLSKMRLALVVMKNKLFS